ncbi:MAG: tetratricopeptide repeat protein [Planctomycetes bacterium]|nr:tetratricopeptide repeat protein [Planctomycetota bacterium]
MLQLVGFFFLTFAVLSVLRMIPGLGAIFQIPLLGFFLAAILVSTLFARLGSAAVDRRRFRRMSTQLGAVETPHNQGKLGSLLLAQGRAKAALECLARAVAGESESLEWRYRYGLALLESGKPKEAAAEFAQVAARDEEYAYGDLLLRLSQARLATGDAVGALDALERHLRAQGDTPESLYRRALALRALRRGDEARAALARVGKVAEKRASFQKRSDAKWVMLSWLRRVA